MQTPNLSFEASFGSALAVAARSGNVDTLKVLLENGADSNLRLGRGSGSTLAPAVANERIETARLLIEQGADWNMQPRDHGGAEAAREFQELQGECSGSALIEAIVSDRYEIAKCQIGNGTDVNLVVESGLYCSALQVAVECYDPYRAQLRIDFSRHRYRLDIIELLIKNGANVNLQFETGRCGSALAASAFKGRKEIVETLLNAGAIATLALNHGDYATALDAAIAGEVNFKDYFAHGPLTVFEREREEQLKRKYAEVIDMLRRAIEREARAN